MGNPNRSFVCRLLSAVVLACAVCVPAIAADTGSRIFDMPYLMRDLDNGLRVVVVPTDYPDIVSLQIPVQTGSRNEVEPGKSGFAHFFEHMMFRGTEKYPAEQYLEILKNAGADQNAYTTDDYTNYHITFTKTDLEKVLELEADRFMNLQYSEDQFRTEALAVKGEYLKNYSNPVQKLLETIRDRAFTTHTYKHTTMGFLRDIEMMPDQMEYSRTFFDRWYRPEKTAVILVGDVEPEPAFALVKKYFGSWRPGDFDVDIPVEPPPAGPIYEHIQWEAPTQPWVVMAFRGPAFRPPYREMPAMDLLSEIYFSETSEVYQKLLIEERLVDQFFSYFPNRKDPGLLYVFARLTDRANAGPVREALVDTIVAMRTQRIDDDQLARTQARLKYGFTSQMDNSEAIGSTLAQFVHHERTPETVNDVYASYAALTSDDLLTYANRYFTDAGKVLVTLSNDETMADAQGLDGIDTRVAAVRNVDPAAFALVEQQSAASPLVDVSLLFHVGPALDPPGKKGLAALTAAMITDGGSVKRSIQQINDAMYPMAAGFHAQVDKEMTRLSGTVHKDNLERWYRLALEQLRSPGWRDEDLVRIKTQMINAVRTDLVGNNDEELGKEVLYASIYGPAHPYGSYNLGATDDIAAITMDDVTGFYERYYVPANLTVGLAGGYDDAFAETLAKDLGRLPQGEATRVRLPAPPPIDGRSAVIVEKETPAVAVSFGFPIDLRRGDKDWVALWLARSWLGEHRSSNSYLYKKIREQRGMNYGDYAYVEYFPRGMFQFHPDANLGRQQQIFQVWIRPLRDNNDAHFATRVAVYEMDRMLREGISEEAFLATRNFLEKFVSLLTATQSRQLGYAMDSRYYDTPAFADYVRGELARLTVDDVNRVVREHLQTENMQFVFVTRDATDLERRLSADEPSPIEYNTPKPELAAEDAVISVLPLALSADDIDVVSSENVFR